MKLFIVVLLVLFLPLSGFVQVFQAEESYTEKDSLRGGLRPERVNFDVLKYNLNVKVDPQKKYISGYNKITFKILKKLPVMQLDLFSNMIIDSIIYKNQNVKYKRKHNAVFLHFENPLAVGLTDSLVFYYAGYPVEAKNPPWDGGFVFEKDNNGKDWVSVAVQGTGASLWYPNKDHQSDQPEEAEIHVAAPNGLMNVSNGRLIDSQPQDDGTTIWSWRVTYPINNYNIILNIGDYVHFSDTFRDLDLNYYVLSYQLEKAKKHFEEVKPMMACFYEHFGEYPFKEDAYKLVESPYLGMEHQSAIAYGNKFLLGNEGADMSLTGIGLKWDFIIIHETAHEWFGNSITASDIADMWIHEAFASYAEAVYIECRWGKSAALDYLKGMRATMIYNQAPIIGDPGVNSEGSVDMYYKGANMLNTLRSVIDDDQQWWDLIKSFSETFNDSITNTDEVISFFDDHTKVSLSPIFRHYLLHAEIPTLQFKKENKKVFYRWKPIEEDFEMPVDLIINKSLFQLQPNNNWNVLKQVKTIKDHQLNENKYYIKVEIL
ncbi:peptidase M1 [Brumimicrobium salinarum]|uniref:Peptidase M1 n=1 Tax=Brumimicrobium salinarum TaxID=2058658 RepID=A0A2I0QZK3_9FLAO|nr:M1 family metallopeptidase [Brumimicrobium salinarum]PKR79748.1 peptidase M1 [Brumimicrobium salinarum]